MSKEELVLPSPPPVENVDQSFSLTTSESVLSTRTNPPVVAPVSSSTASSSSSSWACLTSQYEKSVLIGKGTFSAVLSGICKSNQQKICIKVMDLENIIISFEEILQEIQMMRLCNDSNILTLHTNFVHKESLWLITQLMDKGSCLRVMNLAKFLSLGEGFSEECLSYILFETLKGINYLHSRSLIHRDIKSGNILLDGQGNVKLSDLAFSEWMIEIGQRSQKARTVVGTPSFMAPEIVEYHHHNHHHHQQQSGNPAEPEEGNHGNNDDENNSNKSNNTTNSTASNGGGYDHRADIWSLGITALELAKGYAPYAHLPPMKILQVTLDSDPPSLKNYPYEQQQSPNGIVFSKNFEDFYKKCLQKNPKHRPSASELLKHRLVRNVSPQSLISLLSNIPNVDDVSSKVIHEYSIYVYEFDHRNKSYTHNNNVNDEVEVISEGNTTNETPVDFQSFTTTSSAKIPQLVAVGGSGSEKMSHNNNTTNTNISSAHTSNSLMCLVNLANNLSTTNTITNGTGESSKMPSSLNTNGSNAYLSEDELKTPSRNNSRKYVSDTDDDSCKVNNIPRYDSREFANSTADNNNNPPRRSRGNSFNIPLENLNLKTPYSSSIPIAIPIADVEAEKNDTDNLISDPFIFPDDKTPRPDDDDDTSNASSYIPGTTWVFETTRTTSIEKQQEKMKERQELLGKLEEVHDERLSLSDKHLLESRSGSKDGNRSESNEFS
jgi:serine/threonine-protein kinase OSR1/STK39